MSIRGKPTKGGIVWWVITQGHGERVGFDKREAERLNTRRKKEVKSGTFAPGVSGAVTVAKFLASWLTARTNRAARIDRSMLEHHVLTVDWFARMRMDDVEPRHVQKLVAEIKSSGKVRDGAGPLSPKMVANVFGALRAAFRSGVRQGAIARDVCLLEPGTISKRTEERTPYTLEETKALLAATTLQRRAWAALAFFTGQRCGEVCGRRWRDWDPSATPLGCLTVGTQYKDLPLKTDSPRRAPVHPELAAILGAWELEWELVYGRKPTPDDFIVPRLDDLAEPLSNSAAYKAWAKDCARAGVPNRTQHSTRHTFLTEARRGGATREVIERVTHNASGVMVDHYTHWDWAPLCEAVLCLPSLLDSGPATGPENGGPSEQGDSGSGGRTRTDNHAVKPGQTGKSGLTGEASEPLFLPGTAKQGAEVAAGPLLGPGVIRCPAAWSLGFAAARLGVRQ